MMDVLLDDDVAGQPGPVDPVANHVLHLGPAGLRDAVPQRSLIANCAGRLDVANHAVADAFPDFDPRQLAAQLRACQDRESEALGTIRRRLDRFHAGHIDCEWLLEEDVFARVDGGGKMHRPKMRRRGIQNEVDAGLQQLLICIEPDEAARIGNVLPFLVQIAARRFDTVRKYVRQRGDLQMRTRVEEIQRGAAPATTASDETCLEYRAVWRLDNDGRSRLGRCAEL